MPRKHAHDPAPSNVAFDQTLALDDQTFTSLLVTGDLTPYDEYLCELDKVPVLRDPIAIPQSALPADFRQGQRRDVRREQREDGYTLRESQALEREALYREYLDPKPAPPTKPARAAKAPAKPSKRKPRKKK